MKVTNCLFFTTLYKETRRTFAPLHATVFFLQNLQCLEGWNSAFEEDMPGGTHASENERSQTCIQVTMLPLANPCARNTRTFPAN